MNKLWLKLLLIGLTGFGGGFAAGFFTHKKMNDVKFEEVSEEEMAKIEERVNAAKEKAEENKEKDIPSTEDLPEDEDKLRMALQGKTPYYKADEEQKKAYEKLWNATKEYSSEENANDIPTQEDEEDSEDDEDTEDDIPETDEFVDPPHEIDLADFWNDRNDYDKVTINWFEPDNVWVDENEDIIPDPKSYIGMEVKDLFASNSPNDDPDTRFVRNDKYKSDYEITRRHRSYHETVGGVD